MPNWGDYPRARLAGRWRDAELAANASVPYIGAQIYDHTADILLVIDRPRAGKLDPHPTASNTPKIRTIASVSSSQYASRSRRSSVRSPSYRPSNTS